MHTPKLDFVVIGLPRSGTTWIANFLTTDHSLCMHDPFAQNLPESWDRDERKFGISCTLAYHLRGWLQKQTCPVAIIERDHRDCDASLRAMGFTDTAFLQASFSRAVGRVFEFDSLWTEDGARALWQHVLPAEPFDLLRYRQLVRMQVQPHPSRWTVNIDVLRELIKTGYLER